MNQRAWGIAGMVVAAHLGLTLCTGYGVAWAEPSSDSGATAAADSKPKPQTSSGPVSKDASTADADASASVTSKGTQQHSAADPSDDGPGAHGPVASDATVTAGDNAEPDTHTDESVTAGKVPADQAAATSAPVQAESGVNHHGSGAAATSVQPAAQTSNARAADVSTAGTPAAADTKGSVESGPAAVPSESGPAVVAPSSAKLGPVVTAPTPAAAVAPVSVAPREIVMTPIDFVVKFLSALGLPGAPTPADSPTPWSVLEWVRRQFVGTLGNTKGTDSRALAATTTNTATTTINVKDYGAIGDGITDDSAAIKAAAAALTSGERLYLPEGDYRFAQQNPVGNAAILIKGLSNVTVEFAAGARLLMDDLDANGYGTSHGIRVEGAASNVTILNPTIQWVTRPSARSFGDGISVLGWPSDTPPPAGWTGSTGTVQFVSVVNGRVVNAPQAGAVFMGCSDVTVTNFTAIDTLADGLHFNANRRVTVDGLVAQNNGDDGLAFVTYYDPTQQWTYGPTDGPFNQAGLGEWNNGGSVASHITVSGGPANGVRVQGGYDITISDVTVTDKAFGIQVNSAIATGPGDWTSLASRNIDISNVTVTGAQTGIVLATNNIAGTEDSKWWDFSGVSISDVTIHGSKNWSLAVETPATATSKFAGVTLKNVYADAYDADGPYAGGNGGILLASLHDSVIDNVHLVSDHGADINVLGAGQLRGGVSVDDLPASNLTVDDLEIEGPGRILIQDIAGVQFGNVASYGAQGSAVVLYRVKDASFGDIVAYLPGRGLGDGRGVQILQVDDVDIANIEVTTDDHIGSSWWAVELGGGNPDQIAGTGVRVEDVTYVSGRDATDSDIVVQGGPDGPVDWFINAHWLHQGEATPQWRSASYGDTSSV